jgi:hypothetical protein
LRRRYAADKNRGIGLEGDVLAAEYAEGPRPARRRRSEVALATAAIALALSCPTSARAQSPMIQGWMAVNSICKGNMSDDAKTKAACKRRDDLSAKLKRRGCQYQEDGDWWKCPHH